MDLTPTPEEYIVLLDLIKRGIRNDDVNELAKEIDQVILARRPCCSTALGAMAILALLGVRQVIEESKDKLGSPFPTLKV